MLGRTCTSGHIPAKNGGRQRRGDVDAVDAREVHAAHLEQLGAQVELRRVARPAALLALGGLAVVSPTRS